MTGDPTRLGALTRQAGWALLWERIWRASVLPLVVVAAFLAVSWLGLWLALSPVGRMIGVASFALAFLTACIPLFGIARPSESECLSRVDLDAGLKHRPATVLSDTLALGHRDDESRLMWDLHRRRSALALEQAKPALPRPDLPARDPRALRIGALLATCIAAIAAGPERLGRLASAFEWQAPSFASAAFRIDGWIDPPAYTRIAPTILTLAAGSEQRSLAPPVNSTLVLRASGATSLHVETAGGLTAIEDNAGKEQSQLGAQGAPLQNNSAKSNPPQPARTASPVPASKAADGAVERRWTITDKAVVSVKRGRETLARIELTPVPDTPPSVSLTSQPQGNVRGTLTLNYKLGDDYGIASAQARMELVRRERQDPASQASAQPPRPLFPAPEAALTLPGAPGGIGEAQTIVDLINHPWAGARVKLRLAAKDEPGQEGESAPIEMVLPQRPFTKPLARALVELRRTLALDANAQRLIVDALDALMIAPERFTPEAAIYLGLKTARVRLAHARSDADLVGVTEYLWDMAIRIEDGDLSETERELRAAEEALRQAIERGASENELSRLSQNLRAALDKFLNEMAEQARRDNQTAQGPRDPNMRSVRPEDLKSLLDRMEQAARSGDRNEARRLLNELQSIMDNLQMAKPGRSQDPMAREMNRSMEDLDRMIRDQQGLRDDTFRQGQERRQGQNQNQRDRQGNLDRNNRQQGPGQRQQQQRPGQRGQQGQQGEQQQAEGGEDQQGQGLNQRQQGLREKLEELKRRMRSLGLNGEQGLEEAEQAMREAEQALGPGGSEGQAVDAQGRALEGLQRGAQGMAQQMQQGDGSEQADQDGDQPGNGRPGSRQAGGDRDTDPLDRPRSSRDNPDSRVKVPGRGETATQRAQRVLEELRRRVGDPERNQEELDYLRRLLSPY